MHRFVLGNAAFDLVEKADEFLMPVALHVAPQHLAGQHVQRGKERCGAIALIIMGHRLAASLLQRQARLGAVKGLDLRLLIDAQHHRMGGRANV